MKQKIKQYENLFYMLIIILASLIVLFAVTQNKYIFGAYGDWFFQSVTFLEYFRDLFYETGELFPNLALHIGGGQNIYYFSYYGLFSPCYFLFCLIPKISAGNFVMVSSFLNIILSTLLLYVFLIKSNYNKNISLFGALLLLVSTPFVYFNFKFIMFVQYFPFLLMGLFGTKKYLEDGKSLLLIISIFLIIITSYYFSIPSIICLCLYALYYYMKIKNNIKFKVIFKDSFKYISRILLGIMLASFLLLPVLYVVFNGRELGFNMFINDIISKIRLTYLMYSANGLGLSSVVLFSLVYNIIYNKRENKILVLCLFGVFGFNVVNLLLNGMLYINGKVWVPFLPLFIILILDMLNHIEKNSNKRIFIIFIFSLLGSIFIINFFEFSYFVIFCLDLLLTYIVLILFKNKKKNIYLFGIIFLIFLVTMFYVDYQDTTMLKEDYYGYNSVIDKKIDDYINNNTLSMYRTEFNKRNVSPNYSDASSILSTSIYSSTYNGKYRKIFENIFNNNLMNSSKLVTSSQNNLFWEKYMGIRYLLTDKEVPYGYKLIKEYNNISLYENKNVYSIGFAASNLLNYDEYDELSFIDKLLAYQNNIIIDGESVNSDLAFNYKKLDLAFKINNIERLQYKLKDNHYIINSLSYGNINLLLDKPIKDKTLIIRFKINNDSICDFSKKNNGALEIVINDIANVITCKSGIYYNNNKTFDYVISSNNDIAELNIEFYEGVYDISDIEIYAIDNSFFDKNNTTPLNIDFDKTNGDDIYGSIDVLEDGYFVFTIPYDKGYTIYVDSKKVDIEQVNSGFIGFKIDKGKHDIHLTFEAPYAKLGKFVSLIGIIIFIILNVYERRLYKKV